MFTRLQPDEPKQQVRIFMTGDAGLQVHAHSYFEVEDKKTGEVRMTNQTI